MAANLCSNDNISSGTCPITAGGGSGSGDWWSTDRITRCFQSLSCPWCQGRTVPGAWRPDESSPICTKDEALAALRSPSCSSLWCRRFLLCAFTLCAHAEKQTISLPKKSWNLGQLPFWMLPLFVQRLFHGQSHCAVIGTSLKLPHRLHDHFTTTALLMNNSEGARIARVSQESPPRGSVQPHVMREVPMVFRGAFRSALRFAMQEIVDGVRSDDPVRCTRAWKLFFLLSRMLLFRPVRGGSCPDQVGVEVGFRGRSSRSLRRRRRDTKDDEADRSWAMARVQLAELSAEAGFGGSCSGSRFVGDGTAHQPRASPGNRFAKTSCAPRQNPSLEPWV